MKTLSHGLVLILAIGSVSVLPSCTGYDHDNLMPASQKRMNETRVFEAKNRNSLLKAVITTLQDQGYNIVKVNLDSSEITAQRDSNTILSVILYPAGEKRFAVRVNAQIFNTYNFSGTGYENVTDPQFYQKEFFEPLSRSIFLQKENL